MAASYSNATVWLLCETRIAFRHQGSLLWKREYGTSLKAKEWKNTFVQHELLPAAEGLWRWQAIYLSLWEDRSRPMAVITRAVEQGAGIDPIQRLEREHEGGASGDLFGRNFNAAGKRTAVL
jgi:hypothetical protein